MLTVSVHIVTYNSEAYIQKCIQSVLQQTYPIQQIIVIDNQSADRTLEAASQFDQIQLIANEENVGFAEGHNQAIALSKSDYCLVLNPDVVLSPEYVERLVAFAERHPDAGGLTGKLVSAASSERIDSTGIAVKKSRRAIDRGASEPAHAYDQSQEVFGVSGAAAFYSRKMIDDLMIDGEFFDEDFFAYKEDVDISWRGRLLGWKFYYVADAEAEHVRKWQAGKRREQSPSIRSHSLMNRWFMMVKNDSWAYYLRHAGYILAYDLAVIGYVLLKERELLKHIMRLMPLFPKMVKKRKLIRSRKRAHDREIFQFFE